MKKQHYSTSEVADILHLSRISIFNRIKNGRLKAEKIGRNYIISYESLVEALGRSLGNEKRVSIEKAVDRATKQYKETFRLLGEE